MAYRTAFAFACCALACGGAAAGQVDVPYQMGGAFAVPITSMKEARFQSTARQQYDFSCGSAALSTLLTHHYGFRVTEQLVFEAMFREGDQDKIRKEGFSLLDMKRYLETHGFEADGFEAPLDKLSSAAIPAIVLINENGYNHFVVVKGLRGDRVLIGDPAGGTRVVPRARFETMWSTKILFVISNQQARARFNEAADWNVAQRAPLEQGIQRNGLSGIVLPKHGPGDF